MLVSSNITGQIKITSAKELKIAIALDHLARPSSDIKAIENLRDPSSKRYRFGALPFSVEKEKHLAALLDEDVPILKKLGVTTLTQEDISALIAYRYKTNSGLPAYIEEIVHANCPGTQINTSQFEAGLWTLVGLPASGKSHIFSTLRNRYSDIIFIDTDSARLFWFAHKLLEAEEIAGHQHDQDTRCKIPYTDVAHYIFRLTFRTVSEALSKNNFVMASGLINAPNAKEIIFLNHPEITYEELIKLDVPEKKDVAFLAQEQKVAELEGTTATLGYTEVFSILNQLYGHVQRRVQYYGIHGNYSWSSCPEMLAVEEMRIIGNPLMDRTALLEILVGYANDFQSYELRRQSNSDLPQVKVIASDWSKMDSPDRENRIISDFEQVIASQKKDQLSLPKRPNNL